MKDHEYYIVHGWQKNQLGLRGKELQIYAIIYGFSQDGHNWYQGTDEMLGDIIDCTPRTARDTLKSLTQKGLIEKLPVREGRSTYMDYRVVMDKIPECGRPENRRTRGKNQPVHGEMVSPSKPVHGEMVSPHKDIRNKDKASFSNFKKESPPPATSTTAVAEKKEKKAVEEGGGSFKNNGIPTLDEVRAYFTDQGYTRDPQEFFDFNELRGWQVGAKKMTGDVWKKAANLFAHRESKNQMVKESQKELDPETHELIKKVMGGGKK